MQESIESKAHLALRSSVLRFSSLAYCLTFQNYSPLAIPFVAASVADSLRSTKVAASLVEAVARRTALAHVAITVAATILCIVVM